MTAGGRKFCAGWLGLHLLVVFIVSLGDLASILPGDRTVFSGMGHEFWKKVESITALLLGRELSPRNPIRQAIAAYANCAGIDFGYSYFAPTVSENPKLIFELRDSEGRITYDLPHVGNAASGYRIAALLDNLQHLKSPALREAIVQSLAYTIRREHHDAVAGRAYFATAHLPAPAEFRAGKRLSYELRYTYEFRFEPTRSDQ